ncbi:MAG: ATP-binding protein [Lewinellaceae bacterium]|nr:ATP-binding protein [Lewinellaceae bacterium]
MLILIAGLPGTGKTTVAKAFARKYGAAHFNSDSIRREMGLWGSYRPEDKARVYAELLRRTHIALAADKTVVVDSTFFRADLRRPFEELAENLNQKIRWVLASAPAEVLLARVAVPRADSEADGVVLEKIQAQFEPLKVPHLVLPTADATPEDLADALHEYVNHE